MKAQLFKQGVSPMGDFSRAMTVRQLVDLLAHTAKRAIAYTLFWTRTAMTFYFGVAVTDRNAVR